MARPKTFDPDDVIDRAVDIFQARGYEEATVQELVAVTGVNRASIYAEFGNKEGLFAESVLRYLKQGIGQQIIDAPRDIPIRKLLKDMFDKIISECLSDNGPRTCLVTTAALNYVAADSETARKIRSHFRRVESDLYARLVNGQSQGEISASLDPLSTARGILGSIHGMRVIAKIAMERDTLEDIAKQALAALD